MISFCALAPASAPAPTRLSLSLVVIAIIGITLAGARPVIVLVGYRQVGIIRIAFNQAARTNR